MNLKAVAFADQSKSPTRDEQEIAALLDRFVAAAVAGDIDGMMKLCLPDVFVFDIFVPREAVGTAEYGRNWKATATHENFEFTVSDLSITAEGTIAFSHSINRTSGIVPGGRSYDTNSRVTTAYQKIDGRWFIAMDHWSWPVDPDTGQADSMSKS